MHLPRQIFPILVSIIWLILQDCGEIQAATALTNTLGSDPTDLLRKDNDLFATGIKMFGAFSIVIAVFGGFVLAVKKWGHLATHSQTTRELNVLEFKVLAHKTYLYVLEHQKDRFVIAVGPNGTTLISPKPAAASTAEFPFPSEDLAYERHQPTS